MAGPKMTMALASLLLSGAFAITPYCECFSRAAKSSVQQIIAIQLTVSQPTASQLLLLSLSRLAPPLPTVCPSSSPDVTFSSH